jgi:hypothetical protein
VHFLCRDKAQSRHCFPFHIEDAILAARRPGRENPFGEILLSLKTWRKLYDLPQVRCKAYTSTEGHVSLLFETAECAEVDAFSQARFVWRAGPSSGHSRRTNPRDRGAAQTKMSH